MFEEGGPPWLQESMHMRTRVRTRTRQVGQAGEIVMVADSRHEFSAGIHAGFEFADIMFDSLDDNCHSKESSRTSTRDTTMAAVTIAESLTFGEALSTCDPAVDALKSPPGDRPHNGYDQGHDVSLTEQPASKQDIQPTAREEQHGPGWFIVQAKQTISNFFLLKRKSSWSSLRSALTSAERSSINHPPFSGDFTPSLASSFSDTDDDSSSGEGRPNGTSSVGAPAVDEEAEAADWVAPLTNRFARRVASSDMIGRPKSRSRAYDLFGRFQYRRGSERKTAHAPGRGTPVPWAPNVTGGSTARQRAHSDPEVVDRGYQACRSRPGVGGATELKRRISWPLPSYTGDVLSPGRKYFSGGVSSPRPRRTQASAWI
ncbi:hypothetical protein PYCC9005_004089 [Savitreella phatthalungensis]